MPGIADILDQQRSWNMLRDGQQPQVGQRYGNNRWTGSGFVQGGTTSEQDQLLEPMRGNSLYGGMDEIMKLLQPYFNMQRGNLQRQQTSALGDASRFGGAYAAAKGYDNPYSFQENSRNKVYGAFAPQFGNLQESQMGQLLNSTAQSNQFKNQNQQWLNQFQNQQGQQNWERDQAGFDFFRDLLPFLLKGGASVLTGGLGGAAMGGGGSASSVMGG
jgi:hypothetical protein